MRLNPRYMHWTIAYRNQKDNVFQIVPNPTYAWAADPFLVEYEGRILLFAELFLYKTERNGVIGYCEYQGDGFSDWRVTMDEHWHLSYPNVFVKDGRLLMCPESYQKKEVGIYELQKFPNRWKQVDVLFHNVQYVDTTFLSKDDKNYLFTFRPDFKGDHGELLLYKQGEYGKFEEYLKISDDVSVARPGGNFIFKNDKLFRISQNSEHSYGEGLVVSQIDSLWPQYSEHVVKKVFPDNVQIDSKDKYFGIHTYNQLHDLEVIDLKLYEPTFAEYIASRRTRKVFTNKY